MAKTVMSELVVRMTAETAALKAEMERVRRSVDTTAKKMSAEFAKSQKSVDALARGLSLLKNAIAGLSVAAFAREIFQVTTSFQAMSSGLKAATGSTEKAASSMGFVRSESKRLGLDLLTTGKAFTQMAASAKGTVLEGEGVRKIFTAVSEASTALGLSSATSERAFVALSQMMGKGKITAEELRGQLAEAIPGAVNMMAEALGVSTAALDEMMKKGQLTSADLIKLADVMSSRFGSAASDMANSAQAQFNRMKSAWDELVNAIGSSGVIDIMSSAFQGLAQAIDQVRPAIEDFRFVIKDISQFIEDNARAIKIAVAAVASMVIYQTAIGWVTGLSKALQAMNGAALLAFGPAGAIALGVGILATLISTSDNATKSLSQLNAELVTLGSRATLQDLSRQLDESITRANYLREELAKPMETGIRGAGAEKTRRQMAEELHNLEERIDLLNGKMAEMNVGSAQAARGLENIGKAGTAAGDGIDDARSELEKLNVPYAKLIEQYSELYGVVPKVTAAVMKAESSFNQMASSGKAYGLMQLVPGTFHDMLGDAAKDIYNVNQNIQAGTKYLGILIKQFGDLPKALAAYNAGPSRVMQAVNIAMKEGVTWQEAFAKTFPKAWKETGPYIQKVLGYISQFGEGKYEIDAIADAQKDAAEAAKRHDEALSRLDDSLAQLEEQSRRYTDSVKAEAQAAQDALLQAQNPEAYKEMIRAREQIEAQNLAGMYDHEAQAALRAKYSAEDLLEAYQVRQGWAEQVLQGFDSLWSNMISGAENAMDALEKTLKSWLYAIGQWLLKQAIIIPITAKMFGVSEKSLGGGLINSIFGPSSGGVEKIVSAVEDVRGETQKTAAAVNSVGKTAASIGGTMFNFLGGLFQGTWQFLASIITLLSTGSFAQAGESMAKAGTSIADGFAGLSNFFGGNSIATSIGDAVGSLGTRLGSGWLQNLGIGMKGVPNWGLGVAGVAGGFIGSRFGGYGSIGGSLGGMGGALLGQALIPIPVVGAVIGTILGSIGGGALGGLFGKEKVKGGVAYWNPRQGAGAAHGDTDPQLVELMGNLGDVATRFDSVLDKLAGYNTNTFGGGFWLDTNTAGRVAAAYNSWGRGGLRKADFASVEDAAKWFVDQMVQDVNKEIENMPKLKGLGEVISRSMAGMGAEDLIRQLEQWAIALPSIVEQLGELDANIAQDAMAHIQGFANSVGDVAGILSMAQDVQDQYAASLNDLVLATQGIKQEEETLADAYVRGKAQFAELRNTVLLTHQQLLTLSGSTLTWAEALVQVAGGLEQLNALQRFFFENFYTEAERTAAAQRLAQAEVDRFNQGLGLTGDAAIDTREELRAYIESLDLSTRAGMEAYVAALKLAEAMATLDEAAEEATQAAINVDEALKLLADYALMVHGVIRETSEATKEWAAALAEAAGGLDQLAELQSYYFENYYTEAERQARTAQKAQQDVDEFNKTLGLSGDAAIDTKDELRRYIESLDLSTEAGRNAYIAALKLAVAIDTLSDPAGDFAEKLHELRKELDAEVAGDYGTRYKEILEYYNDLLQKAEQYGANEEEIQAIRDRAFLELKRLYEEIKAAFDEALQKVIDLKVGWAQWQLNLQDKIAGLGGGTGASPEQVMTAGQKMVNLYEKNWEKMTATARMDAINNIISMTDQWVSANENAVNAALAEEIDAINKAADIRIEAINEEINALSELRSIEEEKYQAQLDALNKTYEAISNWIDIAKSLNDTIEDLTYSTANPVPTSAQLAALTQDIAALWQKAQTATGADLESAYTELQQLLERRLTMAQGLFQRPSSEYQQIYAETMSMLNAMDAVAQQKADEALALQRRIEALQEEMTAQLDAIDAQLESLQKNGENQIDAINKARDAQIAAAEANAKQQLDAVYATAKANYEQLGRMGDQVYEEMIKEAEEQLEYMRQQLEWYGSIFQVLEEIRDAIAQDQKKIPEFDQWVGIPPGERDYVEELPRMEAYATGTDYVPRTGPAWLHQGEGVLTEAENRAYQQGESAVVVNVGGITVVIKGQGNASEIEQATQKAVDKMIPYIKRKMKYN